LSWSDAERTLLKAQRQGQKVPALENKPVLFPDLELIWAAFWILNRSRMVLTSPQALQVAEITSYLDLRGVMDHEVRMKYFYGISILDHLYLQALLEEQNANATSSN